MKKLLTLLLSASAAIAGAAHAQSEPPYAPLSTDIQAPTPYSAYVQDSRGIIARNPFGLCWRTGYWTPADAVPGCDAPICVEPEKLENGKCVAPPKEEPPVVEDQPPATKTIEEIVTEKVSYSADAFFDFDKSVLKPAGKQALDELVANMDGMDLEVIIAVGHTDWIGTNAYNDKLSLRRAAAVKAYLEGKGVEASRIFTDGKGELQPRATNKTAAGRAENRRVEIELVGKRSRTVTRTVTE